MALLKSSLLVFGWFIINAAVLSPTLAQTSGVPDESVVQDFIEGRITSSKGAISGATVIAFGGPFLSESVSDNDGAFRFKIDHDEAIQLLIVADEMAIQIQTVLPKQRSNVQVRLKPVREALQGRIIDYQGKGVAEAKLRIRDLRLQNESITLPSGIALEQLQAVSDEKGFFKLAGFNSDTVGNVQVSGKGFVSATITPGDFNNGIVLAVQPARSIRGLVIDQATKDPVTDVVIRALGNSQQAPANQKGEFELTGLPAFQPVVLYADPNGDKPFLAGSTRLPVEQGFEPSHIEIELRPGIWIHCKIEEFGTSTTSSADVFYFPTPENDDFQSFVETFQLRGSLAPRKTNSKGEVKTVAIPGPGVIAVAATGFPPNESINKLTDEQRNMLTQVTGRNELTAVAWIHPKNPDERIDLKFLVSKGRSITVDLINDQLAPSDPIIVHRAGAKASFFERVRGPQFIADQFQPGETRQILIHAPHKGMGAVLDLAADSPSPVQVDLESTGSLVGQILDADDNPQQGLSMRFETKTDDGYQEIATQVFTDVNGRFEKPSLIAGINYRVAVIRLTQNSQTMMARSPKVDSRWYVADTVAVNSGEEVDLGKIVLGADTQPSPLRRPRKSMIRSDTSIPTLVEGRVVDENNDPIANAAIQFNTWPNRTGEAKVDLDLGPLVLSQSRTDSNGQFQLTLDPVLGQKIIAASDGAHHASIVIVADKMGTVQIPIDKVSDPRDLKIQMTREMIVRGKVISENASPDDITLQTGSRFYIYDIDSINQIVTELQNGISLEKIREKFTPVSILDPLAGGLPSTWKTSSTGSFLVRNIPINSMFELTAIDESGQSETITVISRPIKGFDFQVTDDSKSTQRMQGSRIQLKLGSMATGESN